MNLKGYILENLPSILTGVAVAGVVEAVYLAVKATPKALEVLEEVPVEEMKNKKDVVKHTWKCYIPAAIAGAGTIACIVGANYAHLSREAGMHPMDFPDPNDVEEPEQFQEKPVVVKNS